MRLMDSALTMPRTCVAADRVFSLDSVGSTNTYAADLVRSGELYADRRDDGEIAVVCADEQTAGRGRLDHQWTSEAGESFTVSFVVSVPTSIVRDASINGWLQMSAGLAVLEAIREACPNRSAEPRLKWPNDVFANGRKLGGILAEMVPIPDCGDHAAIVLGIGLNLNVPADRLPTGNSISLQMFTDDLPDPTALRDELAARIAQSLRIRLADFETDPQREARRCLEAMNVVCWTLGKPCEAHFTDGSTLQGQAISLNPDASLTLRDRSGALHRVTTADVGVLQGQRSDR
ncbi:biotin--[acetyl-CoA-carboxylase] ligase [Bifidobacterium moukalabense]|uniref:Biotin--acetyl-CoA-carboxylase ligase birA n=1 Tax=Bifidobacterium moukalabense DSM 27321 TaxID=1435051 RepID=W4N6X5_9BIFI|nr:biotin--[acetyl-CoA-carboxylase] ligase [Bifidobacterium moukalabense]ETY70779.1 biotin--acetyl-CoA-carboxylase ligase birA [Bifidobacterium moukalabense DSM 27321]